MRARAVLHRELRPFLDDGPADDSRVNGRKHHDTHDLPRLRAPRINVRPVLPRLGAREGCFLRTMNAGCGCAVLLVVLLLLFITFA